MNPQEQFCPNPVCQARGKAGDIGIHSQKEQRYRCKVCGKTFSASTGTAYYGLKKPHEVVRMVITLLAFGCPIQAIVMAFGLDERTVWKWLERGGEHSRWVHQAWVEQARLNLEHIQADELKVKTYRGIIWMGMVMMVSTRLWLGGAVQRSRGKPLLSRVLNYARRSGKASPLLIAVDGLNIYLEVIPRLFTHSWNWLQVRRQGWTEVAVVQTMKQRRGQRGRLVRHIAQGNPTLVRNLIRSSQGHGWINTAYIERLNATFRLRLHCLTRSGRTLVHQPQHLEAWMWLVGSVYNFCTYHHALRLELPVSPRKHFWIRRTPAIAAGLTDHLWSVDELLTCKRPPVGWAFAREGGALHAPRYHA